MLVGTNHEQLVCFNCPRQHVHCFHCPLKSIYMSGEPPEITLYFTHFQFSSPHRIVPMFNILSCCWMSLTSCSWVSQLPTYTHAYSPYYKPQPEDAYHYVTSIGFEFGCYIYNMLFVALQIHEIPPVWNSTDPQWKHSVVCHQWLVVVVVPSFTTMQNIAEYCGTQARKPWTTLKNWMSYH